MPRSGCSRSRSTASSRCGDPNRCSSNGWSRRSRPRSSRAAPPRIAPAADRPAADRPATDHPTSGIRAGIAGTRFSATVAAVVARAEAPILVPPGGDAEFLAPHPSGLLTADPDVRARLLRFGLRRIGAVAELPRSALVARFGEEGARVHARSRGEELEPFRPRRRPPSDSRSASRSNLPSRTSSRSGSSSIDWPSLSPASSSVAASPPRELAFTSTSTSRSRAPAPLAEVDVEQRFPEPTADAEAIERLLFARLERTPPPAAVARLALELDGTTPAAGQQLPLFTPQAARAARLDWQLARLALTFGEDRVRRVDVIDPDAPLPEMRWAWRPVDAAR